MASFFDTLVKAVRTAGGTLAHNIPFVGPAIDTSIQHPDQGAAMAKGVVNTAAGIAAPPLVGFGEGFNRAINAPIQAGLQSAGQFVTGKPVTYGKNYNQAANTLTDSLDKSASFFDKLAGTDTHAQIDESYKHPLRTAALSALTVLAPIAPELGVGGKVASGAVGAGFGAQAVSQVPGEIKNIQSLPAGPERTQAITEATLNTALGVLGAYHAGRGLVEIGKPVVSGAINEARAGFPTVKSEGGYIQGPSAGFFDSVAPEKKFVGPEGQARAEVTDATSTAKPIDQIKPGAKLPDVLQHPTLYQDYPQFKDINVAVNPDLKANDRGSFDPNTNTITLNADHASAGAVKDTLLHEVQHGIQTAEGFAPGASSEAYDKAKLQVNRLQSSVDRIQKDIVQKNYGTIQPGETLNGEQRLTEMKSELADKQTKLEAARANRDKIYQDYFKTAGEAESRAVSARSGMDQAALDKTNPYDKQYTGVNQKDLVVTKPTGGTVAGKVNPDEIQFVSDLAKQANTDLPGLSDQISQKKTALLNEELGNMVQEAKAGGITQGGLHRNADGDVIGRSGRTSTNPDWYKQLYQEGFSKTRIENAVRSGFDPLNPKTELQKRLVEVADQRLSGQYTDKVNGPMPANAPYVGANRALDAIKEAQKSEPTPAPAPTTTKEAAVKAVSEAPSKVAADRAKTATATESKKVAALTPEVLNGMSTKGLETTIERTDKLIQKYTDAGQPVPKDLISVANKLKDEFSQRPVEFTHAKTEPLVKAASTADQKYVEDVLTGKTATRGARLSEGATKAEQLLPKETPVQDQPGTAEQTKVRQINLSKDLAPETKADLTKFTRDYNAADLQGVKVRQEFKGLDKEGIDAFIKIQKGEPGYEPVREYFDKIFPQLKEAGIGKISGFEYRGNYLPQIWDNSPEEIQRVFGPKSVTTNPSFTFQRVITDYEEGIKGKLVPKFKTVGELAGWYEKQARQAIASAEMFKSLQKRGELTPGPVKGWDPVFGTDYYAKPAVARAINNFLQQPDSILRAGANASSIMKRSVTTVGVPKIPALSVHGINLIVDQVLSEPNVAHIPGTGLAKGMVKGLNFAFRPGAAEDLLLNNIDTAIEYSKKSAFKIQTAERAYEPVAHAANSAVGGILQKIGDVRKNLFETNLFDKTLPAMEFSTMDSWVKKLVKSGMERDQAIEVAGKAVTHLFQNENYDEMFRGKEAQQLYQTVAFAPSFYEGLAKTSGNVIKSLTNHIADPEYKVYRGIAVNVTTAYVVLNMINKALSGHYMYQNQGAHKFGIETSPDGKVYIPAFGSQGEIAGGLTEAVGSLATKGDITPAANFVRSRLSGPAQLGISAATNTDRFGRDITSANNSPGTNAQNAINAIVGSTAPPPVQAASEYAQGKITGAQALQRGTGAPVRFAGKGRSVRVSTRGRRIRTSRRSARGVKKIRLRRA